MSIAPRAAIFEVPQNKTQNTFITVRWSFLFCEMPKSVTTPRKFLELAARQDAKWVKVKKVNDEITKFKLRTTKYLYTLTVKQAKFVQLVTESIPQGLEVIYLDKRE